MSHTEHFVYVNTYENTNVIKSWKIGQIINEMSTKQTQSESNTTDPDVIVLDSDDDDDESTKKLSSKPGSFINEIIDLDSDNEETEIKIHRIKLKDENGATTIQDVPEYAIAYYDPPKPNDRLGPEIRVIAKRQVNKLPFTIGPDGTEQPCNYDLNGFYSGVISDLKLKHAKQRYYLVFFDDGLTQYIPEHDIRRVYGNYGYTYVHANAHKFCNYYFDCMRRQSLPEITPIMNQQIKVYLKDCWCMAKVKAIDPIQPNLVKFYFEAENYGEWLYIGSPRISRIWKHIYKAESRVLYDPNETCVVVSSDSEDEGHEWQPPKQKPLDVPRKITRKLTNLKPKPPNIRSPKKLIRHRCSNNCVYYEQLLYERIFGYDPLTRPLASGWRRRIQNNGVIYMAPCGRLFQSIDTTHKYLIKTESELSIDCFTFDRKVDCLRISETVCDDGQEYLLNDVRFCIRMDFSGIFKFLFFQISLKQIIPGGHNEMMPIRVISITGNLPFFEEYVTHYYRNPRSKKVPAYLSDAEQNFRSCCDCEDNCVDQTKCSCIQLTLSGSKHATTYQFKRLMTKVDTGIYECNSGCKCKKTCLNRLVTHQVEQKLEIFETVDRGYGVRSQKDLPKGTFVCCYFGDLLHGRTADIRGNQSGEWHGDEYFMSLDHIETAEAYKDGYESDVPESDDEINSDKETVELSDDASDEMDMPAKRLKSDIEQIDIETKQVVKTEILSYFPKIIRNRVQYEMNQRTELYGEDETEFVVDGRFRGNMSRFFNVRFKIKMKSHQLIYGGYGLI